MKLEFAHILERLAHNLGAESEICGDERNALLLSRMGKAVWHTAEDLRREAKDLEDRLGVRRPATKAEG